MKSACRSLAITCLCLAGLVACASEAPRDGATNDQSNVWTSQQTTVVHYTTDDFKALPAGQFLHVDLNDPKTVYSINYGTVADLDRVLVTRGLDQYVLSQRLPPSAGTGKQIILGADEEAAKAANALDPKIVVSCTCPCCITVNNITVCCL